MYGFTGALGLDGHGEDKASRHLVLNVLAVAPAERLFPISFNKVQIKYNRAS